MFSVRLILFSSRFPFLFFSFFFLGLRPFYPAEFKYLIVPLRDVPDESLEPYFDEFVLFVDQALASGGRVFVHCMKGVSRSAAMVCSWLIARKGMSPPEALEFLRAKRPLVDPNEGFRLQLHLYYQSVLQGRPRLVSSMPNLAPFHRLPESNERHHWFKQRRGSEPEFKGVSSPAMLPNTRLHDISKMRSISAYDLRESSRGRGKGKEEVDDEDDDCAALRRETKSDTFAEAERERLARRHSLATAHGMGPVLGGAEAASHLRPSQRNAKERGEKSELENNGLVLADTIESEVKLREGREKEDMGEALGGSALAVEVASHVPAMALFDLKGGGGAEKNKKKKKASSREKEKKVRRKGKEKKIRESSIFQGDA